MTKQTLNEKGENTSVYLSSIAKVFADSVDNCHALTTLPHRTRKYKTNPFNTGEKKKVYFYHSLYEPTYFDFKLSYDFNLGD